MRSIGGRAGVLFSVLIAGGVLFAGELSAEEAGSARVLQFDNDRGESVQAVLVKAARRPGISGPQNHVILFDTSASQTGEHRRLALAAVESFRQSLPATHRIRLFAVDLEATELTDGFQTAGGTEATRAMQLLARRAPLGATDLAGALDDALTAAAGSDDVSILYVGDGISGSQVISRKRLEALVSRIRERRIPVSSFAVGPRRDLRLLGILSHLTGGVVTTDDAQTPAATIGRKLATGAATPVVFPEKLTSVPANTTLIASQSLPVRSDRETVLLSRGAVPTEIVAASKDGEIRWSVTSVKKSADHAFIETLVQRAELNPIELPFAGAELLDVAKTNFAQRINQLVALGDAALLDRDLDQALQAGRAIAELDPTNEDAQRFVRSVAKIRPVSLLQDGPNDPSQPSADPFTQQQTGSLIAEMEQIGEIIGQRLQLTVSRSIQEARKAAEDDPDAALGLLKRALGAVRSAQDINPDLRVSLAKRLQGVIADVKGQKEVQELREIRAQERVAALEAQRRLVEQLELDDDRMERLIDRVRSLLEEAERGNPSAYLEAEAVADEAVRMRPGNGTATAARLGSEAAGQLYTAYYLRNLRADRFLETLEQVERSHVPFPDEPPVRWPAPEVWKALTERRKQYASVDLHKASTAEKRIIAALDDPTSINFSETPLTDAIDFITRQHEIPIILDKLAIEEAGLLIDEPIDLILAGVTLRSALKIMLEDLELTYVIEDEVMKITTVEIANEKLSTRVYPVGDLVVQLNAQALGGGVGGALGGGGGLGGGGLGGGGLGQQGGGGFGGGGQFMVAPPQFLPKGMTKSKDGKAPAKAKKPADPELQKILNGILSE